MSDKTRPDDDDDDDPEEKNWGLAKKGKRVNLSRWKKGKKPLNQRRKVKAKGISVNSGCWGRRMVGGCYVCLKEPKTLDSPGESPTSDPNSSEFNFDMLRGLIEKNDFLSKECNPHV